MPEVPGAVPDAVSGQGGHDATFRAACECWRFGLTESQAWDLLSWFNAAKCRPPWGEPELRHKLKSARDKIDGKGEFGIKLRGAEPAEHVAATQPAAPAQDSPAPAFKSVRQLMASHPGLREPVIYGLLRQGETMNIIAPPKTGKSWLVTDLAIAVATGRPWLGEFPTVPGNVLIIDNELHGETSANRIPQVATSRNVELGDFADRLFVENLRGRLTDLFGLAGYFGKFAPGAFKLIILDAFYRFMPKDASENDNATVGALYNFLDLQSARLNCCFVLIHHSSKGGQAGKSVTDVGAGAGSQSRAADTHLVLRAHETDGAVVLDAVVRSWQPIIPRCLRWTFPTWQSAPDLDSTQLKREGRQRKAKEPKPPKEIIPPPPEMTPAEFVAKFITDTPKDWIQIVVAAGLEGLSKHKAKHLLRLAVANGNAFAWKSGANQPVLYATCPKPVPPPSVN